jgi:hypothetical protein
MSLNFNKDDVEKSQKSLWTIDENDKLIKDVCNKKSYERIALENNKTISSVIARVISHIIYPKYDSEIDFNIEKKSEEYKISSTLINKYIINMKKKREYKKMKDEDTKRNLKYDDIMKSLKINEIRMDEIIIKLDKLLNIKKE